MKVVTGLIHRWTRGETVRSLTGLPGKQVRRSFCGWINESLCRPKVVRRPARRGAETRLLSLPINRLTVWGDIFPVCLAPKKATSIAMGPSITKTVKSTCKGSTRPKKAKPAVSAPIARLVPTAILGSMPRTCNMVGSRSCHNPKPTMPPKSPTANPRLFALRPRRTDTCIAKDVTGDPSSATVGPMSRLGRLKKN